MKITKEIIDKYLAGDCTEAERALVESWYINAAKSSEENVEHKDLTSIEKEIWASIKPAPSIKAGRNRIILVAASVILLMVCTLIFFRNHGQEDQKVLASSQESIMKGGKKAILTLADGKRISLDSLSLQDAESSSYLESFVASFSKDQPNKNSAVHEIAVPKGGEFHFSLADGTKVWLNSESSLSFPAEFSSTERHVSLSGEGYFEVAKDKSRPFTVKANSTEIKVLGTHFNVSAYKEENKTLVTLAEGSVEVKKQRRSVILVPNQVAETSADNQDIKVSKANVGEILAWKDGFFVFDNHKIEDIMKTLSRWYDFDVVYTGQVTSKTFGGTFSRSNEIRDLLTSLESLGAGHFRIEGRRVLVMP